jgi:hypothetical protein
VGAGKGRGRDAAACTQEAANNDIILAARGDRGRRDAFATFSVQYLTAAAAKGCIMRFVCARAMVDGKRGYRRRAAAPAVSD